MRNPPTIWQSLIYALCILAYVAAWFAALGTFAASLVWLLGRGFFIEAALVLCGAVARIAWDHQRSNRDG